jgi:hypothetical protein
MYSELMKKAVVRTGPVTFMLQTPQPGEYRCVIAYRRGSALNVMSSLSDLYHFYDLYSTRCVWVRSGPTPAAMFVCHDLKSSLGSVQGGRASCPISEFMRTALP